MSNVIDLNEVRKEKKRLGSKTEGFSLAEIMELNKRKEKKRLQFRNYRNRSIMDQYTAKKSNNS